MIAPVWFLVALLAFGAVRPDYSHLTKAVSELGVFGAPNALAWNVVGFGAVGVLIVVFAWGLWRQTGMRLAAVLVAICGIGFAAAGIPADMSDMHAGTTRLHILASLVSFAGFAAAIPAVGWALWKKGRRWFALAAITLGVAATASVLMRETSMPPGLAQRISFLASLLWIALIASGSIADTRKPC